jgi:hypothetical protein
MDQESLKSLKKNNNNKITLIFTVAYNATVNGASATPNAAWAMVEDISGNVILIKESKSTSEHYAKQDIGYTLHSPLYSEHFKVSNEQYDHIFGKDNWEKKWLTKEEFIEWKKEKIITTDKDARSLQNASWKSTGHRKS